MLSKHILISVSPLLLLARAQNSIPIATNPIVVTNTVPTVVESLSTSLSVSTSVSNADTVLTLTTTDANGAATTVLQTATSAGPQARILVTVTNVQTVQVSSNIEVVSTVGSTTIFGPDTNTPPPATTSSSPPETTSTLTTSVQSLPPTTSEPPTTLSSSEDSSTAPTATFSAPTNTPASSSSSSSSSSGLSGGAKAGIAIAVVLGVALAAFLVWFFIRRKRRATDPYLPSVAEKKRNKKNKDAFVYDPEDTSYLNRPYGSELANDSSTVRYEMQGTGMAARLKRSGTGGDSSNGTGYPPARAASDEADHWPMGPPPAQTAELDGGRPKWGRGAYEKG